MAKTFKINANFTATLSLQTAGVDEYVRAIREADEVGEMGEFSKRLVGLLDEGKTDEALVMLFKHGIRAGLKDLGDQLNNELLEDHGKFKHAPATVSVVPATPLNVDAE